MQEAKLRREDVKVGIIYRGATIGRDRLVTRISVDSPQVTYVLRGKHGGFNGDSQTVFMANFLRSAGQPVPR